MMGDLTWQDLLAAVCVPRALTPSQQPRRIGDVYKYRKVLVSIFDYGNSEYLDRLQLATVA